MFYVTKANGEKEAFDESKIINSIHRAGIPENIQKDAISFVKKNLYDNIPTSEIYQNIIEFLQKSKEPYVCSKYKLKEAIMNLGPTGYPFEDYFARILNEFEYETQVRQVIPGKCINHEIDIIARKDNKKIMIEAKYHNFPGTKTDVHVALYTKARFDDIREKNGFNEVWLATNTKCTIDAIAYAHCTGLKVVSWSYPEGESLRDMIEKSGLNPITSLTTITSQQKQKLLQSHIVLCKDIKKNPNILSRLNLSEDLIKKILTEINFVCKNCSIDNFLN